MIMKYQTIYIWRSSLQKYPNLVHRKEIFKCFIGGITSFKATLPTEKNCSAYIVNKVELQYNRQQTNINVKYHRYDVTIFYEVIDQFRYILSNTARWSQKCAGKAG